MFIAVLKYRDLCYHRYHRKRPTILMEDTIKHRNSLFVFCNSRSFSLSVQCICTLCQIWGLLYHLAPSDVERPCWWLILVQVTFWRRNKFLPKCLAQLWKCYKATRSEFDNALLQLLPPLFFEHFFVLFSFQSWRNFSCPFRRNVVTTDLLWNKRSWEGKSREPPVWVGCL